MTVTRRNGGLEVSLSPGEVDLFRLTLRRATFEDTPPERQREILDFAAELLRRSDDAAAS
jgi:hypothetical protein